MKLSKLYFYYNPPANPNCMKLKTFLPPKLLHRNNHQYQFQQASVIMPIVPLASSTTQGGNSTTNENSTMLLQSDISSSTYEGEQIIFLYTCKVFFSYNNCKCSLQACNN